MSLNILSQIKSSSNHQLYTKYKIFVNVDGTVYDKFSNTNYQSLIDWVNSIDKQDFRANMIG